MEYIIPILIILSLLLISAFLSGGELALMALDPIALETRVRQGSLVAKLQQVLRARPQRFLSTILIGYNVANISLTAYVTLLAIRYLAPLEGIGEDSATLISTVAVTIAITIFAELLPKTVAAVDTVRVAGIVTLPMYIMDVLLTPLNWLIGHIVTPLVYLITGKHSKDVRHGVKRADVLTAISMAHAGGELHHADLRVASEAVRFSTRSLADVMTPRVDLMAVQQDCTVGKALRLMLDSGFSRLPVFGEDMDEIHGALLMKNMVQIGMRAQSATGDFHEQWESTPAAPHMRRVLHLPATKSVVDSLAEMQRERVHMAVVVDEHGGTAGIATLEDILEELVGEIHDESDPAAAQEIVRVAKDYTVVTGRARVDQVPVLADAKLDDMDSTTIGGLVMEQLGRPAVVGDRVAVGDATIVVLKVLRTRIKLLRVEHAAKVSSQMKCNTKTCQGE